MNLWLPKVKFAALPLHQTHKTVSEQWTCDLYDLGGFNDQLPWDESVGKYVMMNSVKTHC